MNVFRSEASVSNRADRHPDPTTSEPEALPPSVAPSSDRSGTILSIQALRFFAALSVVLFHSHLALVDQIAGHQPDAADHAFEVGASGVHVFFVISGFVMVYTTFRSRLTPGEFLWRRLVRIYPIYWLMVAAYLLAHLFIGAPYSLSGSDIGGAALLLPGFAPRIIGPSWTLSYEMYFYLCFAGVLSAGLRRGFLLLTVLYAVSICAGVIFQPYSAWGSLATGSLLLEFIAGGWLGFAFAHGLVVQRPTGALLLIISGAAFLASFWLNSARIPSVVLWGVPSVLLVTGALAFEPMFRSTGGRALAKMGDSSYLLYLSHVLVVDAMIAGPIRGLVTDEASAVALAAPLAVACTLVAAIGYEIIERPLLNAMKRVLPRRRTARSPAVAA